MKAPKWPGWLGYGVRVDSTPLMFMEAQVGPALSQSPCLDVPHRVSVRENGDHVGAGGPVLGCTCLYEPCSPVSRGDGPCKPQRSLGSIPASVRLLHQPDLGASSSTVLPSCPEWGMGWGCYFEQARREDACIQGADPFVHLFPLPRGCREVESVCPGLIPGRGHQAGSAP